TVKMTVTNISSKSVPDVEIRRISELSPDEVSDDGFESSSHVLWLRTANSVEAWNDLGNSGGKKTPPPVLTPPSATGNAQRQLAARPEHGGLRQAACHADRTAGIAAIRPRCTGPEALGQRDARLPGALTAARRVVDLPARRTALIRPVWDRRARARSVLPAS